MADQNEGLARDRAMLDVAHAVMAGRTSVPSASRTRAAAVLGRSALEHAVRRRLRELTGESFGPVSARHQLICLRELTDGADWARSAAWAYSALSNACHEHAYELEPNAHEVEHLLGLVEGVVNAGVTQVVGAGG